jgi:hypothetical protein
MVDQFAISGYKSMLYYGSAAARINEWVATFQVKVKVRLASI